MHEFTFFPAVQQLWEFYRDDETVKRAKYVLLWVEISLTSSESFNIFFNFYWCISTYRFYRILHTHIAYLQTSFRSKNCLYVHKSSFQWRCFRRCEMWMKCSNKILPFRTHIHSSQVSSVSKPTLTKPQAQLIYTMTFKLLFVACFLLVVIEFSRKFYKYFLKPTTVHRSNFLFRVIPRNWWSK